MLKSSDFVREFPVKLGVDRDCEIPLLMEFLQDKVPIGSLLDVGAHSSASSEKYGEEVRKLVKLYDGIDILFDAEATRVLDNYHVGDATKYPLERHETVICVSSIEHAGVSTYKAADSYGERDKLFARCLELAEKYLWISFPVGLEYTYPNELSIIPDKQLKHWEDMVSDYKVTERFIYSQGPQAKHPWYEHNKREFAVRVPYVDYIGNQSICVLEVQK